MSYSGKKFDTRKAIKMREKPFKIKNDIDLTIEVKKVEHDEAFYFWVESMLSINKIDTDAEIRKWFLERMGDEEATFYLGQRKKAIKEGSEFKLERFGLSDEVISLESVELINHTSVDFRGLQILCWDFFGAIKSQDYKKGHECFNLIKMVAEEHDEIMAFQEWKASHSVIKSASSEDLAVQYAQYVLDKIQKKGGSGGLSDAVERARKVIE